jgi:hypothetical protein
MKIPIPEEIWDARLLLLVTAGLGVGDDPDVIVARQGD